MVFISAGHNPKGIKKDFGAVGNGQFEANLTVEFRNLVIKELELLKVEFIQDNDSETLAEYLRRIKTGDGSVVLEFHFDASNSPNSTGCTAVIGEDADRLDKAFAIELVKLTSKTLKLKNRGVISEADSHRGRLGLMREVGTVALLELGFITNKSDLEAYINNKNILAKEIAALIKKYEELV